jgi:hypothetical protein
MTEGLEPPLPLTIMKCRDAAAAEDVPDEEEEREDMMIR